MSNTYYWHPQFKVYRLNTSDLLLLSESQELFLPSSQYPGLIHLDGKRSLDELHAQGVLDAYDFNFLCLLNQLKDNRYLVDTLHTPDLEKCYLRERSTTHQTLIDHTNLELINLSGASKQLSAQWLALIQQQTAHLRLINKVTLLLVDDFLDSRIIDITKQKNCWGIIKITGEQCWISPLSTATTPIPLVELQQSIKQNQPARQLLHKLFPDKDHSLPALRDTTLSSQQQLMLLEQLKHQWEVSNRQLMVIELDSMDVSLHPVVPFYQNDAISLSEQLSQPIKLSDCASQYEQDGGSRNISPEQTVARLKQLISPISGVITHLQALNNTPEKPIEIYSSAFFKCPAKPLQEAFQDMNMVQTCLGKGVSHTQSQASALSEAIERYAAIYRGDEPTITARRSELNQRSYCFQQLSPFSDSQYESFKHATYPNFEFRHNAIPYQDEKINWIPGWSLSSNETVYLPMTCCFSNTPFDDDRFGRWSSNGAAAGNTLEEAILQGLYELIERDATAIWWYNQISRPGFDIEQLPTKNRELLEQALYPTHHIWILDLTTDIAVPVMVAVGQNKQDGGYSFGFGCHLQPELAAQRALTELCQLLPVRDQQEEAFDFNIIEEGDYLSPISSDHNSVIQPFALTSGDIALDIKNIVIQLQTLDFEVVAVDFSRPHLPIKTAKVFVPGLCHIWPELANERLYNLPVKMDWAMKAKNEHSINAQALYI